VGFFDRKRRELAARGIDPARLPPGQYATDRFPVLHVGDVPSVDRSVWTLTIHGAVDREVVLGWDDLLGLPQVELTTDIHCVTKWSKFDTVWRGVRLSTLLDLAGLSPAASHVLQHAEYGYTTNTPLADLLRDGSMLVHTFDGEPLAPEHGGPVRVLVPHLYFWKSAKWVRELEVLDHDVAGFWERNGYHAYGDPFLEQRYS
jgi:DMSO/TMAO reductase YedYZ molybdopterin-dependent catalytic subunit